MSRKSEILSYLGPATKVAVVVLTLALIAEKSAEISALPFVEGDLKTNLLMIPAFWVSLLAPGFYLCALWTASDVFERLNKGDAFTEAVVKGLKDIGRNLITGAVAAILIAPSLAPLLEDGFHGFRGIRFNLEIESLTIGLIGLILYLLAKQGQSLKSELESII